MTKGEINQASKRTIKNGERFSNLIAKPRNQKKQLEKGDTFYSVEMIKEMTLTFYKQVSQLSQVLQGKTLKTTCDNIHFFLYNHIQYQADGVVQNLRSPANAWWHSRESGIDCKSYSIFASSILTNLGLKHYIRQIKQPTFNPKQFTHVYVVVPINQLTGSFDKGHLVIDGTIKQTNEPVFTIKKDVFMSNKLPHLGLNCPAKKRTTKKSTGLKGKAKTITAKKLCSSVIVKDGLKKDGTLKKGFKYAKGGKIVKAKTKK
jgi:hypothetical protein